LCEITELGRPPGSVAGAFDQFIDLFRTLVGRTVFEEGFNFMRRWQRAGNIEADATQEFGIITGLCGHHAQFLQFIDN